MRLPHKRAAYEPGAGLLDPPVPAASMRRPASTVAGSALVLARVVAGVVWLVEAVVLWRAGTPPDLVLDDVQMTPDVVALGIGLLVAIVGGFLAVEAVLALLVLRGRNAPRIALLLLSTLSVTATFVGWWEQGEEVTISTTFLTLSLDILVLLALSSRASAAWAHRPRRHRRRDRRPAERALPAG